MTPLKDLQILAKYRQLQTGNGWHTVPDDGYLYDHLAVHLRQSGLIDELKSLFSDDDWLHARTKQSSYSQYLEDLQVAWEISFQETIDQLEKGQPLTSFSDCLHYSLIETSLRGWAETSTPSIIAQAVNIGIWSPARALSLAELIPDEQRRAEMYAALTRTGKLSDQETTEATNEALVAAKNIQYAGSRAAMLNELSQQTQAEIQLDTLSDALDAALESADSWLGSYEYTLLKLIQEIPDTMLERTLTSVLKLKNPEAKAWSLSELAKRFSEDRQYTIREQALDAAIQIDKSDVSQANAIAQLADQLSGDLVPKAFDAALALKEGDWRPRAIAGLMDKLDEGQIERVLESLLTVENEWWQADGLMSVVDHSSGDVQHRALSVLLSRDSGETKFKIDNWIRHFSTPELVEVALEITKQLSDSAHRTYLLEMLSELLVIKKKEAEFGSIVDPHIRAEAFLADAEQREGLAQSLQISNARLTIFEIQDETLKNQLMNRLREISGESETANFTTVTPETFAMVLAIQYEEERSIELKRIGKHLPEELLPEALNAALKIEETLYCDWAMDAIAERLTGNLLEHALQGRFDYEDITARAYCLQTLGEQLDAPLRMKAEEYAVNCVLNIANLWWRIEPLKGLLNQLKGELAKKVAANLLEVSRQLNNDEAIAHAAVIAIAHLEGIARSQALELVLENVWTYQGHFQRSMDLFKRDETQAQSYYDIDTYNRVRIISKLLNHLEGEQKQIYLKRATELFFTIQGAVWIGNALQDLAPHLQVEDLETVIETIWKLEDVDVRTQVLLSIIDSIPASYLPDIQNFLSQINKAYWRAVLLIALAKRAEGEQRSSLITQAHEAANETSSELRVRLLSQLAALGVSEAVQQGIELAQSFSDPGLRADALAGFLPFLDYPNDLIMQIQRDRLTELSESRAKNRSGFFWFCQRIAGFELAILSMNQLAKLTDDLLDVCQKWQWA